LQLVTALYPGAHLQAVNVEFFEHTVFLAFIKVVLNVKDQRSVVAMRFLKLLMSGRALSTPESVVWRMVDLCSILSRSIHIDSGLFYQVVRLNTGLQRVASLQGRVDIIKEVLDLGPSVLGTATALYLELIRHLTAKSLASDIDLTLRGAVGLRDERTGQHTERKLDKVLRL
jgi:hypothetical protein